MEVTKKYGELLRRTALSLVLPVALLAVWEGSSRIGFIPRTLLPAPTTIATATWTLFADNELQQHLLVSLLRIVEGFALGASLGLIMGALTGSSRTLERLVDPMVQVLRPVPPIAWIPLLILWFGIGEVSKVVLIAIGAFFPVYMNVVLGIASTDHKLMEVGKVFGFSRWQQLVRIIWPSALPSTITGLRIGLGTSWMCLVAAELMGAAAGLGYLIMDARQFSRPDVVIVGMATVGIVGKVTDSIVKRVELRLFQWAPKRV
jgi:sulfonate transport system permease protein